MTHPSLNSIVERLPGLPDDHEDFTPDLAMKIMEKYREIIGQRDAIISELQDRMAALEVDLGSAKHSNNLMDEEMGEWKARALTAESSLSRIKEETIEECARVAETGIADMEAEHQGWRQAFGDRCAQPHEKEISVRREVASAIRSLGSTGGAEKTAESGHSPSTHNSESE